MENNNLSIISYCLATTTLGTFVYPDPGFVSTISTTVPSTTTFTLTTSDGTAVDVTTTNDGTVVFEKIEPSLNFQATDRNKNLKGAAVVLVDKELVGENAPNAMDSARITGDVQYESSQVFTLVPAVKDSLFRDAPPAATLLKVSEMNILTRLAGNTLTLPPQRVPRQPAWTTLG